MAKVPKRKMTEQEKIAWDDTYEYMKELLGYDENQMLPRSLILRLRGLVNGQFIANNKARENAHYSFHTLLATLKYSSPDIKYALDNVRFRNESHKINYIMRIVENNINTVYMRMKNIERQKAEAVKVAYSETATTDVEYRPKKKSEKKDRFANLW